MRTIRLPTVLAPGPELAETNRALRQGEARLEWSRVRQAPAAALTALLAGLDLAADADALGLATVPKPLHEAVVEALAAAPPKPRERRKSRERSATADTTPRVWEPPAPYEPDGPPRVPDDGEADGASMSRAPLRAGIPGLAALRAELEELVLADLLGPKGGPEEEVAEDSVRDRYLVGMLAPSRQSRGALEDDEVQVISDGAPEETTADPGASGPETMFPSSFGLTFAVDGRVAAIRVTARWGRYARVRSALPTVDDKTPMVWKRTPVEGLLPAIPLADDGLRSWPVVEDEPEVTVQRIARRQGDTWIVSLFLVNDQQAPKRLQDRAWLFQPELVVEAVDGSPIFCQRLPRRPPDPADPAAAEDATLAMLYRHEREFAVGHGVSVHAERGSPTAAQAVRLCTRVVPAYEVPPTVAPTPADVPALANLVLDMQALADLQGAALRAALAPLPCAYAAWIAEQRERVARGADGLDAHRTAATQALEACERALARIQAGIDLLATDPRAAEAFRFMNRAMALQRVRTEYADAVRRGEAQPLETFDVPAKRSWRTFQLAFILLSLPALADPHHPDRGPTADALADLLWFPTGGGKTEAYLGLTAYTLAIRRLQGAPGGRAGDYGVAVLMRYTLRLLTLQQFQRAAALICACEVLRQEALRSGDARWGREPFRIGLWVGNRMTPNTLAQADEALKREHGSGGILGGTGSPVQLTHCPWCGAEIVPGRHLQVDKFPRGLARVFTYCGDALGRCPFSKRQAPTEGLPVVVVDEEIYRRLPALLIATVDKFAQMPWNGATQMLFGQVDGRCDRHGFRSPEIDDSDRHPAHAPLPAATTHPFAPVRPPDLIIQDELHLISGSLGTLVGLYETAVDELAAWELDGQRVRPKVIASTATIRRAPDQVRSLFLRQVAVFPPPGLDAADSFFARQQPPSATAPGRRYLGICAQGRRLKAVLIRVYVAYLAAGQVLYERYGAAADPWLTLVGYFNAMRELGGMLRLVEDDVQSRLRKAEQRGLASRTLYVVEELTSRKSATDIPKVLARLATPFPAAAPAARAKSDGSRSARPIDVLLATSMLSVGVDVPRLGVMVVSGQPKSTAEYIQATSRVGRQAPGLVCTVFNWARPRDLSHYERFEHYHATFYQQVEALSVTPFAPRALDRALTALLVALIRLRGTEFNPNLGAGRVIASHPAVKAAVAAIVARAEAVTGQPSVRALVEAALAERTAAWEGEARSVSGGSQLGYEDKRDGVTRGLLRQPGREAWDLFTCLNSLRDVEPTSALVLDDFGLDDEPPVASPTAASVPT